MPTLSRLWRQTVLIVLTLICSSAAGARLAENFSLDRPAVRLNWADLGQPFASPERLIAGLPFALGLLAFLIAHEMGHYVAGRKHRMDVTLPYLIPDPTYFGALGAFVRVRSLIYQRKALFDFAIAGPLAGFAVLVPVLLAGLAMSKRVPGIARAGDLTFGTPLLVGLLERVYFPGVPSSDIYLHPVARAAWVGIFATAMNLLPIGQLDGGHILYALFPRSHRRLTTIGLVLLILLGFIYWPWWVLAAAVYFFWRKHPYIHDESALGPARVLLACLALAIFVLSFMPAPLWA